FSTPGAAPANAREAVATGVHAVIGTTGFEVGRLRADVEAARRDGANCFVAPNFAIGAVLMMEAAKLAATHTAELVEAAGGRVHQPLHSVRLPGLVAHHEVIFGGAGQTLTIRHDSMSRESFMPGVLLAVRKVGSLEESPVIGLE